MDNEEIPKEFQNLQELIDIMEIPCYSEIDFKIKTEPVEGFELSSEDLHYSIDIKEDFPFKLEQEGECKQEVVKNFECEVGNTKLQSLKIHIKTRTGEKPFKCELCNYKCAHERNLQVHLQTHTDKKVIQCDGSNLGQDLQLKAPRNENLFSCEFCDYSCKVWPMFKQHVKLHAGQRILKTCTVDKPYKCLVCDYKYSQIELLKIHALTHSEVKPFACDMCDYKCNFKRNLSSHLKEHIVAKPFQCELCDYKYSRKEHLLNHIKCHNNPKRSSKKHLKSRVQVDYKQ